MYLLLIVTETQAALNVDGICRSSKQERCKGYLEMHARGRIGRKRYSAYSKHHPEENVREGARESSLRPRVFLFPFIMIQLQVKCILFLHQKTSDKVTLWQIDVSRFCSWEGFPVLGKPIYYSGRVFLRSRLRTACTDAETRSLTQYMANPVKRNSRRGFPRLRMESPSSRVSLWET